MLQKDVNDVCVALLGGLVQRGVAILQWGDPSGVVQEKKEEKTRLAFMLNHSGCS